jgi:hypothetical protein
MVFNATFDNTLVILWRFIGVGNRRKQPTCSKSLTNLSHNVISSTPRLSGIRTHVSGDRHRLHMYL